jgi:hypothetical protein
MGRITDTLFGEGSSGDSGGRPSEGVFPVYTPGDDLNSLFEEMTQTMLGDERLEQPQQLGDDKLHAATDFMRSVALTRAMEAMNPTPTAPQQGFKSEAQTALAHQFEQQKLNAMMSALKEVDNKLAFMNAWRQENPEIADELGIREDWFDRMQKVALSQAKRGWRGLDVLLRNLDRGRGAISAYSLSVMQGGTHDDAKRKAWDALRGSQRGWKWVPIQQGPSFKEVLYAAGLDHDWKTGTMAFGLDALVDPINVLGFGAARKGIEIGAHQILNKAGRAVYGQKLADQIGAAVKALGVADETQLPVDVLRGAQLRAADEMKMLVNSDVSIAKEYLDFGGLKIAGYSLLPVVVRKQGFKAGKPIVDLVPFTSMGYLTERGAHGLERLGTAMMERGGTLGERVGKFVANLPDNLQEATRAVGLAFFRTNPAAGQEYKWFKQAEFLDRLSYEDLRVLDTVRSTFAGLDPEDLKNASLAIERAKVPEFLQQLATSRTPEYAQAMGHALQRYSTELDANLIEAVKQGFFGKWSQQRIDLFKYWLANPQSVVLDDATLKTFSKIRRNHYVPHVYMNMRRAKRYVPPRSTPRAPSVVDPHVRERKVDTLDLAIKLGLAPELRLDKLMAVRLINSRRAYATHEYLIDAAKQYGLNFSEHTPAAKKIILGTGREVPPQAWEELLKMRTTASGRVAASTARQVEIARNMAHEKAVPAAAISLLDDTAKREFLRQKFMVTTPQEAARVWKKFVEEPTALGLYDGFRVAPAANVDDAVAAAKNLSDPNYVSWRYFRAGGLADPEFLSRVQFPSEIVDDLERLSKQYGQFAPEVQTLLRLYDIPNFWWKRSVTLPWPAFHFRNKLTNLLNSSLEIGIFGTINRKTMWEVMQGKSGTFVTKNGRKYSYSQLRQAMRQHGIIKPVYRRTDVTEMLSDIVGAEGGRRAQLARKAGIPLPNAKLREALGDLPISESTGPSRISNPLLAPFQAGTDIALNIENADRAQLFMQSLNRGMSFDQAARRVNEFLFDYDDVGMVDREFIRRFLIPFWTWTRKNVALQAKSVVRNPGRFVGFGKFARAMSSEPDTDGMKSDVERLLLPQMFQATFAIRQESAEAWSKYLVGIDAPQNDLNRIYNLSLQRTFQDWAAQFNPAIRTALEYTTEMDFYRGKRYVDFPGGQPMGNALLALPKPMQEWLQLKRVTVRDTTVARVDPNRWRLFLAATLFAGSRLYSSVNKFTDERTTTTGAIWNYLTGIRTEYVRPQEELRRMAEASVFADNTGLREQLRQAVAQVEQYEKMKAMDKEYTDTLFRKLDVEIDTPVEADEVPDEDSLEIQ